MTTHVYHHRACHEHDPGRGHPESPARIEAVERALASDVLADARRLEAPEATREQLARAHSERYVEAILEAIPAEGRVALDGDTIVSPASGEAARRAAGAVVAAVDAVLGGDCANAFCAVRPPGHHAERERAMGFCLFNGISVGACQALVEHGLERVAIVDFDVHHGNGTQHIFKDDARVFYGSSHQMPLYPGTGAAAETGCGNVVNVPLYPGSGSEAFREAWSATLLPALRAHRPELILVSAGFDAHRLDPLAGLGVETEDFAWLADRLCAIAAELCDGHLVAVLEGGYDGTALAAGVTAQVEAQLRWSGRRE